jgi:hypothetical protein
MKKIAIYRIGPLGDTVVALPSFISIRNEHTDFEVTLLRNDDKKSSLRFYDKLAITVGLSDKIVSDQNSLGKLTAGIFFTI